MGGRKEGGKEEKSGKGGSAMNLCSERHFIGIELCFAVSKSQTTGLS